jgi:hypothetical protein
VLPENFLHLKSTGPLVQTFKCGYYVEVKFQKCRASLWAFFAIFCVCALPVTAQHKFIRLRNELIQTPPARDLRLLNENQPSASGLFLIQFTGPSEVAWRQELRQHGVELLRYVPDDAFVARMERTDLRIIRALPFVRWIGSYRPEHKVFQALRQPGGGRAAQALLPVRVMFSPVAGPAELAQARALLRGQLRESRTWTGVIMRGVVTATGLDQLAQSSAVLWIEPERKMKLLDEVSSRIVGGDGGEHSTHTQQYGYDGRGVTVAVADSGLYLGEGFPMHPDLEGRVTAFFKYSLPNASDEHSHGTHVTGIIAGNAASVQSDENEFRYGLGVAPQARIVVQRLFDGDGNYYAPPSFDVLTRDAVQSGAVIGSNSWGDDTQGRYDVSAAEFDALVRDANTNAPGDQAYILEFSAGNSGQLGSQTINSPAVAKNVIATGASESDRMEFYFYAEGRDAMADFSSRGPCEDGRIKPDVVAPGTWIASLRSPIGNDENAWADISDLYLYQGGTSQAGPHVSGAAAVFVQYYRETHNSNTPSPALVKAALINSATDMDDSEGTGPTPNMDEGWGRVDLSQLIVSPVSHQFVDQVTNLTTGQSYEHSFVIASPTEPLRLTLAYTDFPGFPATIPSLVNDLDLELVAPDSRIYRGNQFERGESVPDAPSADNINNVEGIYISDPLPGEYIARVRARNVVQDSCRNTAAIDQDFALAISGDIPPPFVALVLLDRPAYTVPSQIKIKVIDLNRAGQPSVSATLRSSVEANGEVVTLLASSFAGTFTGTVATATGSAASDGRLQIVDGGYIRAEYFDASANTTRVAQAIGDLVPPVISPAFTTNQFGQTVVIWTTDEPAISLVRFGTNSALLSSTTNRLLTTAHEVEIGQLVAGQTYYYLVIAIDAAGNMQTNDNGGALFSFVASAVPTVLLVDGYTPNLMPDETEVNIPLSAYTNALNETGVRYDVWSVASRGMPGFDRLLPYPIVMWRINDSFNVQTDTIPLAQQNAIQQYLNSGGSFFMASMEILSRIGAVPFRTNVFQVGSFVSNPNPLEQCTDCDEDFGVPAIQSPETDPFFIGIMSSLDYTNYPYYDFLALGPDFSDTFSPTTNGVTFLVESSSGKPCGVRYPRTGQDSTGRVVFCSFPLDTVPATGLAPNNRGAFLRRVFQFLAPGFDGVGTVAFNQGRYRLPDLLTIEVADSDLAGVSSATAYVWSTSAPSPIPVMLHETPRRGVFRGFIPLSTNQPSSNHLYAQHGDQVFARYFDESGGLNVETFAFVDAVPPTITIPVTAEPEYEHAVVSWQTSEPCDALVQYGESALLGKTAASRELQIDQEIRLTGLTPDRTYYFRVISRDAAGNAVVDDNNGELFTFRTLTPVAVPFVDSLDGGTTNWSVFSDEDSQFQWRLGTPNNGVQTSAHSGDKAWGSTLYEETADFIDTFLISPAIDLRGGNLATLKFWHSYDFTDKTQFDVYQFGELLIVTNSATQPVPDAALTLAIYEDSNGTSWEEEEIDLSPYVGRVIFLVWHHYLLSLEPFTRSGWLVDDISVTVSNVPVGVIQVSNNLGQASFTLSGPVSRNGQGLGARFTNMPVGSYTATFAPVPFYNTPTPQTQMLDADATITFVGNYTFPDANANGISDLWEMQYFGNISSRDCSTDSDGDGFPDCAEFVAGTNPTMADSSLRLQSPAVESGSQLHFNWTASMGHLYQLQGTSDLQNWIPLSPWMRANDTSQSIMVPMPGPGEFSFFRLQVQP